MLLGVWLTVINIVGFFLESASMLCDNGFYLRGFGMAAPSTSKMNDRDHNPWERKRPKQPPNIDELLLKFGRKYFNNESGSGASNNLFLFAILFAVLLLFWFVSGFYIVKPAEEGVLLRFGRFSQRTDPGLHWMARGIDRVYVLNTNRIETWNYSAEMLTKDENYTKVMISVFYRIANPEDYLFKVSDPITSLENAVASALRQVVGHTDLEAILTIGKEEARSNVEALVNEILNDYQTGIVVTDVKMQEATVPASVIKAFDNVITAREDKAAKISQGERYVKGIIPKALGKASRVVQESNAYKEKVVLDAKADVAKYLALLPTYKKDPKLLTDRIYMETMQTVLERLNKVYVNDANALLYMQPGSPQVSKEQLGVINQMSFGKNRDNKE